MKSMTLEQVEQFSGGRRAASDSACTVQRVNTDSRTIQPGDLFVALSGERFDAHDFIPSVAAAGASAVLVSRVHPAWGPLPCAVIEVGDTLEGLQCLAREYRRWLGIPIIGLTGSNGKTSTKDLTSAVLGTKFQVRATRGNLNNHIGVPLTLCSMEASDTMGVVEMGMNHAGEIKALVDIALPDAAIITNVGIAHIENLGSRDAIGWEKGTLAANVRSGGVVVLNSRDPYTPLIARHCQADVFTAGIGAGDVSARELRSMSNGTEFTLDFAGESMPAFLPVAGEHMVANATLAACLGWRHGIDPSGIVEALREVRLTGGRMEVKERAGIRFIDDSYNANPDSMRAGLSTLASSEAAGRKVAVLGPMGELGDHSETGHRGVGELAGSLKLDGVFSVGLGGHAELISLSATGAGEARHFETHEACGAFLRDWLKTGDVVLLKGSRSARMEKILQSFDEAS